MIPSVSLKDSVGSHSSTSILSFPLPSKPWWTAVKGFHHFSHNKSLQNGPRDWSFFSQAVLGYPQSTNPARCSKVNPGSPQIKLSLIVRLHLVVVAEFCLLNCNWVKSSLPLRVVLFNSVGTDQPCASFLERCHARFFFCLSASSVRCSAKLPKCFFFVFTQ